MTHTDKQSQRGRAIGRDNNESEFYFKFSSLKSQKKNLKCHKNCSGNKTFNVDYN